jgi:hypothetical protein
MASSITTRGRSRQSTETEMLTDASIVTPRSPPLLSLESSPGPATTLLPAPRSQLSPPSANAPAPAAEHKDQLSFPPLTSQAANLFQSAVAFVGDDLALVDDAEYRRRLDVCRTCDRRAGKRCTACGCWIGLKARGRAFQCPLRKW